MTTAKLQKIVNTTIDVMNGTKNRDVMLSAYWVAVGKIMAIAEMNDLDDEAFLEEMREAFMLWGVK